MHFLQSSNLIVIVGGRKLSDPAHATDMNAEFIRETHVLDMRTLEWSVITFGGMDLGGIYNFASCLTDDGDLFLFGGTKDPVHQSQKLFRIRSVPNSNTTAFSTTGPQTRI